MNVDLSRSSTRQSRPQLPARQRGNTLIGIIIGLVIGLGIAVVVALMITKGASPFSGKPARLNRQIEQDAGQAADPNKPMYGKADANRPAVRAPGATDSTAAVPPAPTTTPAPSHVPPAPEPDVLQQAIEKLEARSAAGNTPPVVEKSRPAAPAAQPDATVASAGSPDAGEDKFIYYLQAGAFRNMDEAESARAKLALLGFEATLSDRTTDTGVLHRVRMGPYTQLAAMNRARTKLSENGIDVAVVRNQK
jgi:cell division protein FtsN